jgi:hypothetical protein
LVIVTSTTAGDTAGAVAVIWVLLLTVYDVALVLPNFTPAAPLVPVKPVPVMTTEVPPAVGPVTGDIPVTEGR